VPYSDEQCRAFGAKASRGERVPDDWKQHCRKSPNPGEYVSNKTFDEHQRKMRRELRYDKSDHKD
jgi:hypothetical protein